MSASIYYFIDPMTKKKKTVKPKKPATQKKSQAVISTANESYGNRFDDISKLMWGRPKKFDKLTVKELQDLIADYFMSCYEVKKVVTETPDEVVEITHKRWHLKWQKWEVIKYKKEIVEQKTLTKVPTISGLASFLGTGRQTLINIENRGKVKKQGEKTIKPTAKDLGFMDTIKKAKLIIQSYAEQQLYNGRNVAGVIFSLKNNWGWEDRTQVDNTHEGEGAPSVIKVVVEKE